MTEERFKKLCFKDSMVLEFHEPRTGYIHPCILCAVDFDEGLLKIWVIETDIAKGNQTMTVNYSHIELPKQKLKAV